MRYVTNRATSHIALASERYTYCNAWRDYWVIEDQPSKPVCVVCARKRAERG